MLSDDESDDGGYETPPRQEDGSPPRKKIKIKTKQKFRPSWTKNKKDFGADVGAWLTSDKKNIYKAYCLWCNYSMVASKTVIKDHKDCKRHRKAVQDRAETPSSIMQRFISAPPPMAETLKQRVQTAEIMLSGCMATHNIPFKFVDHLIPTLKACLPDSDICKNIQMKRQKCANIVTNVIAASHKDTLSDKLREVKFSILSDENTLFNTKSSAVAVRYYDKDEGKIVSRLFDLCDVFPKGDVQAAHEGATGARLYDLIVDSIKKKGIPLENVISFGSDAASVNIGEHNSVWSRMKRDFPGIVLMRCLCHSIHLASSEACKCLPRTCEDLARNAYSFLKHSSKRVAQLAEFQDFLEVSRHKILGLAATRWLSFSEVAKRILEQWEALRLFVVSEWAADRTVAAEQLYTSLHDPFIKMYYIFLNWILPKVAEINAYFQSSGVVVTTLHEKMAKGYKEFLSSYMKPTYVSGTALSQLRPENEDQFAPLDCLYLGVEVANELKKDVILARPDLIKLFKVNCRKFMMTLCSGIKARFDFNDPLFESISVLAPKNALSPNRKFSMSLMPFCEMIPRAMPSQPESLQTLDDEWRCLFMDDNIPEDVKKETQPDVFWHKISCLQDSSGDFLYTELPKFALAVLSIAHSNADVERIFSKVTNTRSKHRNRLITKTVEGCCQASEHIRTRNACCSGFVPGRDMLRRMTAEMLYPKAATTEAAALTASGSGSAPTVSALFHHDSDFSEDDDYN